MAIVTAYAVLVSPLVANAQCKADVDCKGDRVCENGQCVDPRTGAPDAPPPPPTTTTEEDDGVKVTISDSGDPVTYDDDSTGWAMPAAIIGFIGAAATLGLSIGAAVTREDKIPSIPLGIAAILLTAAIGPIVFAGGGSARRASGATGLLGLRIAGWVAYGISIATGLVLVLYGGLDLFEPPAGVIIADGVFGAIALTMFSIDALITHGEASQGVVSEAPSLLPTLVMARESSGTAVPTLGVTGRF